MNILIYPIQFLKNKLYVLGVLLAYFLVSCDDPKPNDLLPARTVDVTIDLNLPMYQNLLVPSGYAYTPTTSEYGFKGILIYNKNNSYIAYERACPHMAVSDCTAMTFDGLYLKCTCDNTTFNIFSGGVSTTTEYQAREYYVEYSATNVLRIRNY